MHEPCGLVDCASAGGAVSRTESLVALCGCAIAIRDTTAARAIKGARAGTPGLASCFSGRSIRRSGPKKIIARFVITIRPPRGKKPNSFCILPKKTMLQRLRGLVKIGRPSRDVRKLLSKEEDPNRWNFFGVAWGAFVLLLGVSGVAFMRTVEPQKGKLKENWVHPSERRRQIAGELESDE